MAMAVELAARLNPPLCYAMLLLVVKTVGCLREESRGELGGSQIVTMWWWTILHVFRASPQNHVL